MPGELTAPGEGNMPMPKRLLRMLGAALALPAAAWAHPGHSDAAHPFIAGLLHPLTGWDHLAAMLLVGIWAARLGGREIWALPATFVAGAAVGALAGFGGLALPWLEQGIWLSVLALAAVAVLRLRVQLGLAVAGLFAAAVLHGLAHGLEAPAGSGAWFVCGFLASTAALHLAGIASVLALARRRPGIMQN